MLVNATPETPDNQPGETTNEQKLISYAHNVFSGFVLNTEDLHTLTWDELHYKLQIVRQQSENWLYAELRAADGPGEGGA